MSAYLEHQFSLLKCCMKPWTRLTRGQIYVRTFISLQKPAHLESTAMQRAPCPFLRAGTSMETISVRLFNFIT